jgi:hypothetical protein
MIVTYCHSLESVWRLGYWLEIRGIVVRFPAGQTFYPCPKINTGSGANPTLCSVDAGNAEVKVECCYTFTPTYAFMVYAGTAFHTLYRYYLGVI